MTDRIFAFVLIVVSIVYGFLGLNLNVPFVYDPLGPKPVPLILAVLLLGLALIVFFLPGTSKFPSQNKLRRFFNLLFILFFYYATWSLLGYLLATTISCYLVSRQFGCTWMQGLMTALIVTVLSHGLFTFILDISLPLGIIYSYTGF